MVGHIADVEKRVTAGFAADADEITLVGPLTAELGGSEYQRLAHEVNSGPRPELDLSLERRVQQFVLEAIDAGLLRSCHDLSDGGLAVAVAECCILGERGASLWIEDVTGADSADSRVAGILFGEGQSRFLISHAKEASISLQELAGRHQVPLERLGSTGGQSIRVDGAFEIALSDARAAYESALA
jgi:phosphoribosylformylglycinamidine synthase